MDFVKSKYPSCEFVDLNKSRVSQFIYGKIPDDDFIDIIKKMIYADLTVSALSAPHFA